MVGAWNPTTWVPPSPVGAWAGCVGDGKGSIVQRRDITVGFVITAEEWEFKEREMQRLGKSWKMDGLECKGILSALGEVRY